jgi:D-amino peptidase
MDMEGVAGIVGAEDLLPDYPDYQKARGWMTAEANAAIEGAFEGGASEVYISDSHSKMRNMLVDKLHEDVMLVRGSPRSGIMMGGLDSSFDAAFLVGYHSMAGTDPGVISHSFLLSVAAIRLNGLTVGEGGYNAALAGHYGVPVALVCGDDTLEAEISKILPWAENVITKQALSWKAAISLTPKASQKKIREGAKRALGKTQEMKPFILEKPIRFEIDFNQVLPAHAGKDIPGVERARSQTLAYTGEDMLDVTEKFRLMCNASIGDMFV